MSPRHRDGGPPRAVPGCNEKLLEAEGTRPGSRGREDKRLASMVTPRTWGSPVTPSSSSPGHCKCRFGRHEHLGTGHRAQAPDPGPRHSSHSLCTSRPLPGVRPLALGPHFGTAVSTGGPWVLGKRQGAAWRLGGKAPRTPPAQGWGRGCPHWGSGRAALWGPGRGLAQAAHSFPASRQVGS